MKNPYLLSGSFAYDTILEFEGKFQSRLMPESLSHLNVCFDIDNANIEFGGCAGNIAYSAALLKQKPMLIGTVGTDGGEYLARLEAQGHDICTITTVPNAKTPHAWILTDSQGNQITTFGHGAMKYLPSMPDAAETPKLWHLAPGNPRTTATFAKRAIEEGKVYFFDPGQALPSFIDGLAEDILPLKVILEMAEGIFVNEYEAELLEKYTGQPLAALITRPGQFIVNTQGSAGVRLMTAESTQSFPVAKARVVVDPTGCGDAFRAGFLYGYSTGESLADCTLMGAVLGAFAVECSGGQRHSPSFDEIQESVEDFADLLGPTMKKMLGRYPGVSTLG